MSNTEIKEMVKISRYTLFADDVEMCEKIMREFYTTHSPDGRPKIPTAYLFDWLCLLVTIYNAGRVSGVRAERVRRKAKVSV